MVSFKLYILQDCFVLFVAFRVRKERKTVATVIYVEYNYDFYVVLDYSISIESYTQIVKDECSK